MLKKPSILSDFLWTFWDCIRCYIPLGIALTILVVCFVSSRNDTQYQQGYYQMDSEYYYCLENKWYSWDDVSDVWNSSDSVPESIKGQTDKCLFSDRYSSKFPCSRFEDTAYYIDWKSTQYNHSSDLDSSDSDSD